MINQFLRNEPENSSMSPEKQAIKNNQSAKKDKDQFLSPQRDSQQPKQRTGYSRVQIPQLKELELAIIKQRPNNINDFIRKWAIAKQKRSANRSRMDQSSDQECINIKIIKQKRRNALCQKLYQNTGIEYKKQNKHKDFKKSEEIKSRILIVLRNINLLKSLSSENLWELTQLSQILSLGKDQYLLKKNQKLESLIIILSGIVSYYPKGIEKNSHKKYAYTQGKSIGEQTIVFPTICQGDYIVAEQRANQKFMVAIISSIRIKQMIRDTNHKFYRLIINAVERIQALRNCNLQEKQKIVDIAINSQVIEIQEGDKVQINKQSFFIVVDGSFAEYSASLLQSLNNQNKKSEIKGPQNFQPRRIFQESDSFGTQSITGTIYRNDTSICSYNQHQANRIIQIRISDLERVMRPIKKIISNRNKL